MIPRAVARTAGALLRTVAAPASAVAPAVATRACSSGAGFVESRRRATFPTIGEATRFVRDNARAKFDETVELEVSLGLEKKHIHLVRGNVSLPSGTGKATRVAVFARGAKAQEATDAGADKVGAEDLQELVASSSKLPFDRFIASPDMMGVVGKVARILGPKGLMPNPKLGTLTADLAAAVKRAKAGEAKFRADKASFVRLPVGKCSFADDALKVNIQAALDAIMAARPSDIKPNKYLKRLALSSSMGSVCELDVQVVLAKQQS